MTPRTCHEDQTTLTVYYDGACPLCSREIALYKRSPADTTVCFSDVSTAASTELPTGTTREHLLQRFHALDAQGQLHSGAAAFVLLWEHLPGWRWLASAARWPGVLWLLERCYRVFLRCRPRLQRWASKAGP